MIYSNGIGWTNDVAKLWERVVPPSRPSISELKIYSNYFKYLQSKFKEKLNVLILGSTTEFRDLSFENNCNVTVVDYCEEYYCQISKGLKYKDAIKKEISVFKKWQDINFEGKFHIVIGDLATGNVPISELNILFSKICSALIPDGLFLGKSMCWSPEEEQEDIDKIIESYVQSGIKDHPYTHLFYLLAIHYIDSSTYIWDNKKMYLDLKQRYEDHRISQSIFDALSVVRDMNVNFTIPPYSLFLNISQKYFKLKKTEYGSDAYSRFFPLYIFEK